MAEIDALEQGQRGDKGVRNASHYTTNALAQPPSR